jgi:hypothetical protein
MPSRWKRHNRSVERQTEPRLSALPIFVLEEKLSGSFQRGQGFRNPTQNSLWQFW